MEKRFTGEKFLSTIQKKCVLLQTQFRRKKKQKILQKNEKNIPTVTEKKSEQARFPQENVYRQR